MGSSSSKLEDLDQEISQQSLMKSAYSKLFTDMKEVERVKESWRMSVVFKNY